MIDKRKGVVKWNPIKEEIMNFFFPRHCPICDKISPKGRLICPECEGIPRKVRAPICAVCGKHVSSLGEALCYDCGKRRRYFDRGIALYEYQSVKDSIFMFKNKGRPDYGRFYGREIARCLQDEIFAMKADALVPIPLHPSKQKKRGYNQAAVLAKEISNNLHIPVREDLLIRSRKTPPQKKMSLEERQNNLKKAFHIKENDVKLKSIILVDDVFTTGSTLDAASLVLREAGVRQIYFITLAIGRGS